MQKEKKKRHKYTKKYKKQRTNAVNDADETKITATPMVLNTKGLEAMGRMRALPEELSASVVTAHGQATADVLAAEIDYFSR